MKSRLNPYRTVLAVWVAVAGPCLALQVRDGWRWGAAIEAAGYLGLGFVLASCRALVSSVGSLGRRGRGAVLLLGAVLLGAQLWPRDDVLVAFSRFDMYSSPVGHTVESVAVQGIEPSGHRVAIRPDRLFPSMTHGRFDRRITELRRARERGQHGGATLEDLLHSLGEEWNRQHGPRRVQRVEMYAQELKLDRFPDTQDAHAELVARVDIDGRSR